MHPRLLRRRPKGSATSGVSHVWTADDLDGRAVSVAGGAASRVREPALAVLDEDKPRECNDAGQAVQCRGGDGETAGFGVGLVGAPSGHCESAGGAEDQRRRDQCDQVGYDLLQVC